MSINRWTDKDVIIYNPHPQNETLLSHEKGWDFAVCTYATTRMDWGHYVEWNKSDGEKQTLYNITYMWDPKNETNWWICQKIDSQIQRKISGHKWKEQSGEWDYRRTVLKIQSTIYKINDPQLHNKSPMYEWVLFWECVHKSNLFKTPRNLDSTNLGPQLTQMAM